MKYFKIDRSLGFHTQNSYNIFTYDFKSIKGIMNLCNNLNANMRKKNINRTLRKVISKICYNLPDISDTLQHGNLI